MTPITIFHNPACGTSRNVLALIRNSGVEPRIVEYLKQPPSRDELVQLLAAMQMPVRALLRRKGTPYDDAWRAINQLLIHDSMASHQRNVLLRNDGHGGFDEVSGTTGLDLDQDGRSFAVFDIDRDGDPDLVFVNGHVLYVDGGMLASL